MHNSKITFFYNKQGFLKILIFFFYQGLNGCITKSRIFYSLITEAGYKIYPLIKSEFIMPLKFRCEGLSSECVLHVFLVNLLEVLINNLLIVIKLFMIHVVLYHTKVNETCSYSV